MKRFVNWQWWRARERKLNAVPKSVFILLLASLVSQTVWHATRPDDEVRAIALPLAPELTFMRTVSLGEPEVLAKWLMLWLQAFDNQPGISLPFKELDYSKVISWLDRILDLDPRMQYPLLAASRLYGEAPAPTKQRQMLEFVYRQFFVDPNRRWPWLAHAVYVAKHRLDDLPLALKYAQAIADHATGPDVPHWVQQMAIFVLEDMGELESAKVLLGGLIASGKVTDPNELRFLTKRLEQLASGNEH